MKRLIESFLCLFPYVKSLKAENTTLHEEFLDLTYAYLEIQGLKAENTTLTERRAELIREWNDAYREIESLKADREVHLQEIWQLSERITSFEAYEGLDR